jgi:hypothetical protein
MDRDELEDRLRVRRPGDPGFRRGAPLDDASSSVDAGRPHGYVPFEPEPEDQLAAREPDQAAAPRYVDNTPADVEGAVLPPPPPRTSAEPPAEAYRAHVPEPSAVEPAPYTAPPVEPPPVEPPPYAPPPYAAPPPYVAPAPAPPAYAGTGAEYGEEAEPEYEPGYEQEGPYPYAYGRRGDDGGRRGGGALPIIGFIALCALALAVGAVLAGVFAGPANVAQATPSPTVALLTPTPEPTPSESSAASESAGASTTPEPSDGPVTFPDGAVLTVQACATREMSFDGCDVDGSVVGGDVWVWIGFDDARASDVFILELRSGDQTLDQQEKALGEILDCERGGEPICSGYLIGAAYRDLDPGEYDLVVRRNGDFADRATFRVEASE